MAKKPKTIDCGKRLEDEYARWDYLYTHGGSDPFYSDGCNLELVRNHIIHEKKRIKENLAPDKYPQSYYRELPPEVDRNYMARAEEIRSNAKKTLSAMLNNPNYLELEKAAGEIDDGELKNLISAILRYPIGLKLAIEADNLVYMRRYENPDSCRDSFSRGVNALRNKSASQHKEWVQMTLFD